MVQDTFLRLIRADRARIGPRLGEWLFAVCRNRAVDVLRKESRMKTLIETQRAETPGAAPSPDEPVERRETASAVRRAIGRLPKNQQEVLRLRYSEGLTSREIGRICGLPPGQVRYLVHLAIGTLRRELGTA